jgi:hypothetical protein
VSVSRLTVARDPALAIVVRIFVGAVAERLEVSPSSRDDLRLAASELFAAAVEAGGGEDVSLTIEHDGDQVALSAGLDASADGDGTDREAWEGLGLIRALFPDAEVGRSVRISVPVQADSGGA